MSEGVVVSHAIAPWRLTYTPGTWLVMSGPTSLVTMAPPPARMSELINRLWNQMVTATSIDALLELLSAYGMDEMPDLVALFWDVDGLHGIARGGLRVVDVATGEVVVDGTAVKTWREEALGTDRHLRVDMEPVDQDAVLQLPLVVGAATASAIYVNNSPASMVRFPDSGSGILPRVDTLGDDDSDANIEDAVVYDVDEGDEVGPADGSASPSGTDLDIPPAPEPWVEADVLGEEIPAEPTAAMREGRDPAAVVGPRQPQQIGVAPEPAPLTVPTAPAPPDPDAYGTGHLDFDTDELNPGPMEASGPEAPPVPEHQESAGGHHRGDPVVVAGRFQEDEEPEDEGTIFSTNLAATHKLADDPQGQDPPQVLLAWCPNRHPNPPTSSTCRICRAPVDAKQPQLAPRPLLAGVNTNYGEFANVDTGVVVGRAPDPGRGPQGSYLMRVNSPSSDISRSHLLVTLKDWNVLVTDLNSTNGTTVMPVGEQPFVLANGQTVQVELGAILDLGDGVSLRIEPPRG